MYIVNSMCFSEEAIMTCCLLLNMFRATTNVSCNTICDRCHPITRRFNSILNSLKTPDHWYMRYSIIIYKLQWFTGEGHKKGRSNIQQMQKEEK